ncbi:cation-dependent mannose-6-phosphate receptor-like [Ostrea edulis]|uniref:cation-dependent mannose-6-phosphate receptor-like n=1 Tax=Ostrea edulis TaxID=37623 RepID=UPI0024AE95FB|nr:cation-dependent mannose-6-phosphate receptor-like [Ostrea edulis]
MKSGVILLSLFTLFFCITAQNTCKKVNSCKCKLDDGKVIDLKPLTKSNGPAYLDVLDSGGADLYSWNPCEPFSEGLCTNAAVCQTHAGQEYNCGSQDSAAFEYDSTNQAYTITYQADTYTNTLRTTVLYLYCDQGPDVFQPIGEAIQGTFALIFRGKYACPRDDSSTGSTSGLSAGTILVIICFCLFAVYLIGGILFQVFIRKNSGVKVIPNHSFWTGLPIIIKDGVFFIIRRGGKKTTYNSI